MNILETILDNTRSEIATLKKEISIERLKSMPGYFRKSKSLRDAIRRTDTAVIAEVKKASPSKGILRENFKHWTIAKSYADAGACALSILTDKKYFQGDIQFIADIRDDITIPILRKDFIIDSYQLTEARAYGADAILLIAAALERNQLRDLHLEAWELGLECLVEVHNEEELKSLDPKVVKIIGINNRNLTDFSVDLSTSIRLAAKIPKKITKVSESGITNRDDIDLLKRNGINAFLIGEGLIKADNPGDALRKLLPSAGER
jgi:indole-3-glycerol phosphate synthase